MTTELICKEGQWFLILLLLSSMPDLYQLKIYQGEFWIYIGGCYHMHRGFSLMW